MYGSSFELSMFIAATSAASCGNANKLALSLELPIAKSHVPRPHNSCNFLTFHRVRSMQSTIPARAHCRPLDAAIQKELFRYSDVERVLND
jgi:hypothetical protein